MKGLSLIAILIISNFVLSVKTSSNNGTETFYGNALNSFDNNTISFEEIVEQEEESSSLIENQENLNNSTTTTTIDNNLDIINQNNTEITVTIDPNLNDAENTTDLIYSFEDVENLTEQNEWMITSIDEWDEIKNYTDTDNILDDKNTSSNTTINDDHDHNQLNTTVEENFTTMANIIDDGDENKHPDDHHHDDGHSGGVEGTPEDSQEQWVDSDDSSETFESGELYENEDASEFNDTLSIEFSLASSSSLSESNESREEIPSMCKDNLYFPHSTNCNRFYYCDDNKFKNAKCPPNMWFDPNYINDVFCNYPEVICAADNTVCNCAIDYPDIKPDPLIEPHVNCLANNRFHLQPSKIDCERYFICFNGNIIRMQCKSGFHFNTDKQICDVPEEANCKIPDAGCPAEGITFLSHPTRCEAFYYCYEGHKSMQICPFYHIWDKKSESCSRRDEAVCELEIDI